MSGVKENNSYAMAFLKCVNTVWCVYKTYSEMHGIKGI